MTIQTHTKPLRTPEQTIAGLATQSDRIRALYCEGNSRSEIRRFLGIRYQHVRNVLVRDGYLEPKLDQSSGENNAPPRSHATTSHAPRPDTAEHPEQVRVVIGPGGRVVIPAPYREALGIGEGDAVFMRIEGDELRVVSDDTEVRQVREMIAGYVPDGVSLVDELLRERRREIASDDDP